MGNVKSGCFLSLLILAGMRFNYGQAEEEKAHKTSHAAARTLPNAYFATKYGHSFNLRSMHKPSFSTAHHPTIPVSVSMMVLTSRRARLSSYSAQPSPYKYRPRSSNPMVPYYPFFPLPPPPPSQHLPHQPPKNKKHHNPPSKGNPIVPYFPFFAPPPPKRLPIRCKPQKPPRSLDPKIPYFPFCFQALAPPPPQHLPNQPPKTPHHLPIRCKPQKPPRSNMDPKIPYFPFCFYAPPPPRHLPKPATQNTVSFTRH